MLRLDLVQMANRSELSVLVGETPAMIGFVVNIFSYPTSFLNNIPDYYIHGYRLQIIMRNLIDCILTGLEIKTYVKSVKTYPTVTGTRLLWISR